MVAKWTRENPVKAHLIHFFITVLALALAIIYLKYKYGEKIDQIYNDSNLIKEIVIKAEERNSQKDSLNNE